MSENRNIFDQWGKPNKRVITRLKHIRWIILSVVAAAVLVVAFLVVFNSTDLIAKPTKNLASTSAPGEWVMFGHDPLHSGSPEQNSTLPEGKVTVLLSTGQEMHSSPAVANGTIYVGSRDYNLYAIDAATGQVRWKFKAGSYIDSSPIVADNIVYFGSNDGKLYAVNAATGDKLWDFSTEYAVRSAFAVADGKVYFGADDYNVYALDALSGKKVWSAETGNYIQSSAVVANGVVYIGSADNHLYAIDAQSGKVRLQFPAGSIGSASPAVVDKTVYIGTMGGLVYAIDGNARNWFMENRWRPLWESLHIYGALPKPPTVSGYLWSTKLSAGSSIPTKGPPAPPGGITSSVSISGNTLFVGMNDKLAALDIQSHNKLWEFNTGAPVSSMPAAVGNLVYAPCENGHLYILNAATGEKLKDIDLGDTFKSAPAVVGNTVYLSSLTGKLYEIK